MTGRRVSVSSAGIASAAPATTALRWIKQLEASGVIRREADPQDRRRIYLRLSEEGLRKMGMLLHEARSLLSHRV
jgi:DNA-binding MarR family transcriptional regulator